MSNLEPYPDIQSEALMRASIANKIRHTAIYAGGISILAAAFEVSYRIVEQLPDPLEASTELKGSLAALGVSAVTAAGSALYERTVRRRIGLTTQNLSEDRLSILRPREQ